MKTGSILTTPRAGLLALLSCVGAFLGFARLEAATIQAASCSSSDVQNAINAATTGSTVLLPGACVVTWNAAVTVPDTKGITLNGNGAKITRGSGLSAGTPLSLSVNASVPTRITGFGFSDTSSSTSGYFIAVVGGSETGAKFRIDHCTFTGLNGGVHIRVGAPVYGVIDHNTFTWSGSMEVIHNEAYGATSTAGWTNDVIPGSASALYIEDNVFTNQTSGNPAYFWGASALQAYYGARTVFRHNSLTMAHVDVHGTAGNIGGRWWEIYENTFTIVPNGNQSDYMRLRAGSGVVFNNHVAGSPNSGAGTIELVEEDAGYPALYQVGRGKNQVLDPGYVWNNDGAMTVVSGSSNVQVNRDYMLSQKPGYTPYTYPHPMTVSTLTAPAPPQNIRVIK